MPRHKKKKRAAAASAASVQKKDWDVGDLVVAKLRGHRPWPAQIQKPEDYGYDPRPHRIFVTFFGTEETCFCSFNKITPFTTAVRKNLAEQLQKINTNPELERAIKEIFAADDEMKTSAKAHGSNQKEDDEMISEKSEDEEPPVEQRSRKRARVVEETVAPPVPVADERPAKQEKTVKSMAAEQVQKLPRKVRIKVSTQGSDLGSSQQQGDKAGVSSSQARQSEPVDSAKMPVKNGDRTTIAGKVDDSVGDVSSLPLKQSGESIVVEVEETVRHDLSENGGDATKETHEDSSAKGLAATAKTDSDGVEKMEVEDQKSLVSETTPVTPIEKGDAEKPAVSKTSEPAVEKADDASTIMDSVTSEIVADGVEKMEVDEKLSASKTSEPSISKEDDTSAAKESVVSLETGDDVVDKMEVDDQKSKTGSRPAIVEEESGKGDGLTGKEEASSVVSTNEPQENQSSEAKVKEAPHIVEDRDTFRGGQEEGVPPAAKEGVVDTSKSETQSGVEPEKADDGLQNKVCSASIKQAAVDEVPPTNSVSVISVLTEEEERKGQKDGVVQTEQVSTLSTKDDVVSRTDLMDVSAPAQTPKSDLGEQVHGAEAVASRLNLQAGAVDQKEEDRDGAVKKTEDENGTVNKVVDEDESTKMTEDQDGKVKRVENQDAEVKKIEDQGAEVKKTEKQDVEAKKTEDEASEMKKTEEQDAPAELKKIEKQDAEVKAKEEKAVAGKEVDAKDGPVSVKEVPTELKGDALHIETEKTLSSTTAAAKPEGETPQIDNAGKPKVPALVVKQEDTVTVGTTGNGEVPSTGKQEDDTPQIVEAEKVQASTPATEQDAVVSKEQPAAAS